MIRERSTWTSSPGTACVFYDKQGSRLPISVQDTFSALIFSPLPKIFSCLLSLGKERCWRNLFCSFKARQDESHYLRNRLAQQGAGVQPGLPAWRGWQDPQTGVGGRGHRGSGKWAGVQRSAAEASFSILSLKTNVSKLRLFCRPAEREVLRASNEP